MLWGLTLSARTPLRGLRSNFRAASMGTMLSSRAWLQAAVTRIIVRSSRLCVHALALFFMRADAFVYLTQITIVSNDIEAGQH